VCRSNSFGDAAIYSKGGKFLNLGANYGWSSVTVSKGGVWGSYSSVIELSDMTETSTIYNTKIYNYADEGTGIRLWNNSNLLLDNVEIYNASDTAIHASRNATISNKGNGIIRISTTGDNRASISASGDSKVTLYNTHIENKKSSTSGVLVGDSSTISLTNSSISSVNNNTLISGAGNLEVSLNNVDLSKSKNQRISASSDLTVNIQNGTSFDGYTSQENDGSININLTKSSWNITKNSTLFSLSLNENSFLTFNCGNGDKFYYISAGSVFMDKSSQIRLDLDETKILSMISSGDEFQLFSGDLTNYDLSDIDMFNSDGSYKLTYEEGESGKGWFKLIGYDVVPEPSTSTMSLLGIMCIILRRRRV
jgi:PEP-CTERM putative exosortase interaction domain